MIAELAVANAAFKVIKEAVKNSGEIAAAGQAVIDWFNAKSEIQKKLEEKPPDQRSDLEEFFALEELKKQQQELKELMIYQGRPGLWEDWLKFQVDARKKREAAAAAEIRRIEVVRKKRRRLLEQILLGVWLTVLGVFLAGLIFLAAWVYVMKSKIF
jgi:hypothetical protein